MILVTLGTQKQSFNRLLDMIEKSNINDKIIAIIIAIIDIIFFFLDNRHSSFLFNFSFH